MPSAHPCDFHLLVLPRDPRWGWEVGGGAEHLCLPGGSVYLQRKNGEGVRPAGRPGTLGVRPLTGSVAVADCWRRLRAKTSVAHAAACPTGKGLQSSAEAAQALFGTDGDLVGGDAGP